MLGMNFTRMQEEIRSLAAAYEELPRHIAKKHLRAAMGRAVKKAGGLEILRANTPPLGTKRGRRRKGEAARSTGELRRSVKVRTGWKGTNAEGSAFAVLGYRYGWPSMKAIWAEYGTKYREALGMMAKTFEQVREPARAALEQELADALEKAVKEVAAGKNPGYNPGGNP